MILKTDQGLAIDQCLSCGYRLERSLAVNEYVKEGYIDLNYESSNIVTDIRWLYSLEGDDI